MGFKKKGSREMPEMNTSSLPDLIFTILFFFMMVTTMREVTIKVENEVPKGTELEALEKKSLVTHIYIGSPTAEYSKRMGKAARVQLNDRFMERPQEIRDYINQECDRTNTAREERRFSIKADVNAPMNIVTQVKEQLRMANARRISYTSKQKSED